MKSGHERTGLAGRSPLPVPGTSPASLQGETARCRRREQRTGELPAKKLSRPLQSSLCARGAEEPEYVAGYDHPYSAWQVEKCLDTVSGNGHSLISGDIVTHKMIVESRGLRLTLVIDVDKALVAPRGNRRMIAAHVPGGLLGKTLGQEVWITGTGTLRRGAVAVVGGNRRVCPRGRGYCRLARSSASSAFGADEYSAGSRYKTENNR